jgi:YD repeat-containing protein
LLVGIVPSHICQNQAEATDIASYNTNNQIASTNAHGITWSPAYDAAGNLQSDGDNYYFYDGEGRVCAVQNLATVSAMGYLYDADALGQELKALTGTTRVGGALGRLASDAMPALLAADLVTTVACHE